MFNCVFDKTAGEQVFEFRIPFYQFSNPIPSKIQLISLGNLMICTVIRLTECTQT